jgi:hypothetical protein
MCNASSQSGSLPVTQKQAIVYHRLKKPTLDADEPCPFRPICKISFISKLIERTVTSRFVLHSENNKFFPSGGSREATQVVAPLIGIENIIFQVKEIILYGWALSATLQIYIYVFRGKNAMANWQ